MQHVIVYDRMVCLYFTPNSSSAATFIAAKFAGVTFEQALVVSLAEHRLVRNGGDYHAINPKGTVPALTLDDGTLIDENVGTLYWVAVNGSGVLGSSELEAVKVVNALGFLASEVHQAFNEIFRHMRHSQEVPRDLEKNLENKLLYLETYYLTQESAFMVTDSFSVADAYLYVMLRWLNHLSMDTRRYAKVLTYREKISSLELVQAAHAEMAKLQWNQESREAFGSQ